MELIVAIVATVLLAVFSGLAMRERENRVWQQRFNLIACEQLGIVRELSHGPLLRWDKVRRDEAVSNLSTLPPVGIRKNRRPAMA